MPRPKSATQAKRNRERKKHEAQQEKDAKRALRSEQKKERGDRIEGGEDPDLAGIIPGPQPPRED